MSDLTEAFDTTAKVEFEGGERGFRLLEADEVMTNVAAFLSDRDAMLRVVDGELELVRAEKCSVALDRHPKAGLMLPMDQSRHIWHERVPLFTLTPLEDR